MSDIVFDDSEQITMLCNNLNVQGHDLLLDSLQRRRAGGSKFRRALVHDQNDGLTINFGNDYPGGVTIGGLNSLVIKGDVQFSISHKDTLIVGGGAGTVGNPGGGSHVAPDETVSLGEVIKALRRDIAGLQAQIAKLGPRP